MRRLLFALPILLALGVLLGTWRGAAPPRPEAPEAVGALPRYTLKEAHWTRFDESGKPAFEATAGNIDYFSDESARLKTIELRALGGKASPWRISAPEGYAPPREQRVNLHGPVTAVAQWPEGEKGEPLNFEASQLWVDQRKQELYTDTPVRLSGPNRNAEAGGLRADWTGKKLELLGDVRMKYVP